MSWRKVGYSFIITVLVGLIHTSALANADRVYWIAADEMHWDYAPSFPINPMTNTEFTAEQRVFVEQGIGRRYLLTRPLNSFKRHILHAGLGNKR